MIEAELKARVKDVEAVQTWLRARAEEEEATYHDTYYDWPDHRLDTDGREIRLRTITTISGTKHFFTYKEPSVDQESGSKPERETEVGDPTPVDMMLRGLGLVVLVDLTKHCRNFRFSFEGHPVLATLVKVPELNGTFLEVETPTNLERFAQALSSVRAVMAQLEILKDLDSSTYTSSVLHVRDRH